MPNPPAVGYTVIFSENNLPLFHFHKGSTSKNAHIRAYLFSISDLFTESQISSFSEYRNSYRYHSRKEHIYTPFIIYVHHI